MSRGAAIGKANQRYSNGAARLKLRSWLRSQLRPCWICRAFGLEGAIDYELPARHPYSFEVDELVPISEGARRSTGTCQSMM